MLWSRYLLCVKRLHLKNVIVNNAETNTEYNFIYDTNSRNLQRQSQNIGTKIFVPWPGGAGVRREGHSELRRQPVRSQHVLQLRDQKASVPGHGVRGGRRLRQFAQEHRTSSARYGPLLLRGDRTGCGVPSQLRHRPPRPEARQVLNSKQFFAHFIYACFISVF